MIGVVKHGADHPSPNSPNSAEAGEPPSVGVSGVPPAEGAQEIVNRIWQHPLAPFCVAGPTGSGKSALAVQLAQAWGAEIINVDAYQIYEGLPMLTAQPSQNELNSARHHLYNVLKLSETCNAGRFFRLATEKIIKLQENGIKSLLVGGSGMYLKSLTHGLNELPQADATLRLELASLTSEELARRLLALDPNAGEHVNLTNARHVQRALEISLLMGKPASEVKSAWKENLPERNAPQGIFLNLDRPTLYDRINRRCAEMLENGAIEEVGRLDAISAVAAKAIGVAEIRDFLAGKLSFPDLEAMIAQATRRYAKRQITWFRHQPNLLQLVPTAGANLVDLVAKTTRLPNFAA